MTPPEELSALKPWPLNGYAPGKYLCKCHECGERFEGDKRAVTCLVCAVLISKRAARAPSIGDADKQADDWRDDPARDERWNTGVDYAQTQLCEYLGVDPATVTWDAATETLDGDVQAIFGNILRAKYGEDWGPRDRVPANKQADGLVATMQDAAQEAYLMGEIAARDAEIARLAAVERERDEALEQLRIARENHKSVVRTKQAGYAVKDERLAASEANVLALTKVLLKIASPNTVAGLHEQDRAEQLQAIARAALEQASKAGGAPAGSVSIPPMDTTISDETKQALAAIDKATRTAP